MKIGTYKPDQVQQRHTKTHRHFPGDGPDRADPAGGAARSMPVPSLLLVPLQRRSDLHSPFLPALRRQSLAFRYGPGRALQDLVQRRAPINTPSTGKSVNAGGGRPDFMHKGSTRSISTILRRGIPPALKPLYQLSLAASFLAAKPGPVERGRFELVAALV